MQEYHQLRKKEEQPKKKKSLSTINKNQGSNYISITVVKSAISNDKHKQSINVLILILYTELEKENSKLRHI